MFGYVVPYKPELKIREYEYYKAVYCGICLQTKKIGNIPRIFLNYDFVFLYLVLKEHFDIKEEFATTRCIAHPKNKKVVVKSNRVLEYVSNQMVVLTFLKLYDDYIDEKHFMNFGLYKLLNLYIKKITEYYSAQFNKIKELFKNQIFLEKKECSNMDMVAHNFGQILSEIFSYNGDRTLKEIGFYTGVWIYFVDAIDDYIEDVKKKRYNVLKYYFQKCKDDRDLFEREINILKVSLDNYLARLSDLIKGYNNQLLDNIVQLGMYSKTQEVIDKLKANYFKELKAT
ncbi:DUF5685 family protein [Caldicellulosiruptor morganii]|uniref:DUF5685 family protein n=1 Tax=Caldicellulosiruptor morganii TaxID=1387555 RepID=A0ABY7BPW7_9FIRM|nr:DUF5685 family protein [Caldicellulosiruptor morganii]WAM34878.1 DUF5685 family protein [Caldicellulosiruptor morganii]